MSKLEKFVINFFKYLIVFEVGGVVYYTIELLYRGYSHESMFILGGLCLINIGLINEVFGYDMYFELQVLIGDIVVVTSEFITGLIVNKWLGLNVWDYSNLPFNLMGQICLPFALLWIPVVALAIVVDDWVKYECLHDPEPTYRSWITEKIKSKKGRG
jgi:uncharacterized membrane protein